MRQRTFNVMFLCFVAANLVAIVGLTSRPDGSVRARIVQVADAGPVKQITVEFQRDNPAARFSEEHQMQVRVAGHWRPPEPVPGMKSNRFLTRTNRERVEFTVPTEADACRFLLGYRAGVPPYCKVYFFLQRHGLRRQFPKSSRLVLKWAPRRPRLRHVECELMIPAEADPVH